MPRIDLHVHSNASDGQHAPVDVVARAAAVGLDTVALTDHDTIEGCRDAVTAGCEHHVRVIVGCEFSAAARWGEIHLLGYFLPREDVGLNEFLGNQQAMRVRRAHTIVERLRQTGAEVQVRDVLDEAMGGAVGRPHVARVLVEIGAATDVSDAFRKYLGRGRPAFVPKVLPTVTQVAELVRSLGGVVSAAHLRDRAVRPVLADLKAQGVDAVEVLHPSHGESTVSRIARLATAVGLLRTGGSDWHGDAAGEEDLPPLGSMEVPASWLEEIENLHRERLSATRRA